ncbi:MAG TPA: DJ-1 family protein [Clostridiales bacterium]|nr:DJ-1 family protein [Clostridiales bacterium]
MIFVYIAEGFEEIEALTPVDVLRRAGLQVETVSVENDLTVAGAHGITIVCDTMLAESEKIQAEALILPGGMPGALGLLHSPVLLERLRSENEKGTLICAICAAPMVLAKAGILSGRKAVIYPGMEAEIKGAVPCSAIVCVDENLITSQGPATAMPFSLEILKALTDAHTRDEIKKGLLFHD